MKTLTTLFILLAAAPSFAYEYVYCHVSDGFEPGDNVYYSGIIATSESGYDDLSELGDAFSEYLEDEYADYDDKHSGLMNCLGGGDSRAEAKSQQRESIRDTEATWGDDHVIRTRWTP